MSLKNKLLITNELLKAENWQPLFSKIARRIHVPVTTIFDFYRKNIYRFEFHVKDLSDSEIYAKLNQKRMKLDKNMPGHVFRRDSDTLKDVPKRIHKHKRRGETR